MPNNKDKIRAAAQKYLQKGQIDKAIREFERLVADDPNDVRTLLKIGDLHSRNGDQAAATKTYGAVAKHYSDQGFFLKAVAVYKQILKLDPNLVDINLRLAELYHQLGLVSDAMGQYRAICEIYEKEERWDDSARMLAKMVELDPQNVPARIKLAEVHARLNRVDEAKVEFTRAATALKAEGRMDDYLKVAERLVHVDPTDLVTARELARLYLERADARRALAKLQVCVRANPRDTETLTLLAQAFLALEQPQKAASVYTDLADAYAQAGDTENQKLIQRKLKTLQTGPAPEARTLGMQVDVRPDHDNLAAGVEEVAGEAGDDDVLEVDADALDADVEGTPEAPVALSRQDLGKMLVEADIYIKYGLRNKAIEHLERVLAEEPHNRPAQERLKNVLIDADETASAVEVLWDMAQAAQSHGEVALARRDVTEILELQPNHAGARLMRGRWGAPAAEVPVQAESDGFSDLEVDTSEIMDDAAPAPEMSVSFDTDFGPGGDDDGGIAVEMDVDDAGAFGLGLDIEVDHEEQDQPTRVAAASQLPRLPDDGLEEVALVGSDDSSGHDDGDFGAGARTTITSLPAYSSATQRSVGVQLRATPLSDAPARKIVSSTTLALPSKARAPAGAAERTPNRSTPSASASPQATKAATAPAARTAPAAPAASAAITDDLDLSAELEEVTFFMSQGLTEEAQEALATLVTFYPDHPGVQALQARLADEALDANAAERLEADMREEIAQVRESDDAFEMSFEDVFDQFKKGVAKQVDAEDYDTHYNLGIAYKEMGLFDDAVREFDVARPSATYQINALMMMGLCELERGDTHAALRYLMQGLNSPRASVREQLALRYEVGLAYESMGRRSDAIKFYERVGAMDPTFRDVGNRIDELRAAASDVVDEDSSTELDALLSDVPAPSPTAPARKPAKISYL